MKKSINTKFLVLLLTMLVAFSLFTVTALAADVAESAAVIGKDGNSYTLTYPKIEALDFYSQTGAASHEIDYSAFKINGAAFDADCFVALNKNPDTSCIALTGGVNNRNQWIYATENSTGDITLLVRLSGEAIGMPDIPANRIEFTIVIGEVSNSTIGSEITYTPAVWTMDSYGFTRDTIEFALDDFTIKVNSVDTKLSELENVTYDNIKINSVNVAGVNNSSLTKIAPGEYSLTASNNSNTGDAVISIAITFPRANTGVSITDSSIKVAEIFEPIITASSDFNVKNLTLQQGLDTNRNYDVALGFGPEDVSATPVETLNNNDWRVDFPDFELNFEVGDERGTVTEETLLAHLRFGQLRIYDGGTVRAVDRDLTTLESLDLVDLEFTLQSENYVAPKIIANAETGTIQVTHQNVVLVYPGNLRNIVLTPAENNPGELTRFVYNVTLAPTVTLNYNDGTTPNQQLENLSRSLTLPTPTREGYRFGGWQDEQGVIVTSPFEPTADMTLTALWTIIPNQGGIGTTPINPVQPGQRPFDDVYVSDWYDDDVTYVWENGIMIGTDYRIFSPLIGTSRAMIVTALHRLEGEPAGRTVTFNDVESGLWYSNAVAWGQTNGIVEGWDGMFRPNDNITRQELATIFARYAQYIGFELPVNRGLPDFADKADIFDYAKTSVDVLYRAGIINGKDNNLFDPQGIATRAEVAAMIHRFMEIIK